MGREIRRVPPHWEHPVDNDGEYLPMYDEDFETAANEWINNCIQWSNGTHEDFIEHPEYKKEYPYFWQWDGNPPDEEYYRPKFTEEPTWYQVYQTVSEGTPVTPPFATKEELVNYLVEHGDFYDQNYGYGGWKRKNAESFVESGWSPTGMITNQGYVSARDIDLDDLKQ
jgi:hypothetical protein